MQEIILMISCLSDNNNEIDYSEDVVRDCFHEWIKETIETSLIYQSHHRQKKKRFLNCNS